MSQDRIKAIALTSLDSAGILAAYDAGNIATLTKACNMIRIHNASNKAITISYDGVTDNEYMFPDTTLQIDAQLLSQPTNNRCLFAKNTNIYFKGVAGVGTIYVSGYYQ